MLWNIIFTRYELHYNVKHKDCLNFGHAIVYTISCARWISMQFKLIIIYSYYYLTLKLFLDYNTTSMQNNNSLSVDKSLLDESDFNCVLCCGMFRNPVTTPCGHTYCMDCLEHNFDYSFHCPLCLTTISSVSNITII